MFEAKERQVVGIAVGRITIKMGNLPLLLAQVASQLRRSPRLTHSYSPKVIPAF
jgi:hypothetical protein